MSNLIAIELASVRKIAEQYGDDILLYFIDMAILQANDTDRFLGENAVSITKAPAIPERWKCWEDPNAYIERLQRRRKPSPTKA